MKLWYLGDSMLSTVLQEVATGLNLELVDSSIPDAFMEHVWTEQLHEAMFRAKNKPDCVAVIFVNDPDYDAEVLIQVLLHRVPAVQRIVLAVFPADARSAEGLAAHWDGDKFRLVRLESLLPGYVSQELSAALS